MRRIGLAFVLVASRFRPRRGSEDFGMNKRVLSVCLVLLTWSCATTQRHDGGGKFEIGIVGDRPIRRPTRPRCRRSSTT